MKTIRITKIKISYFKGIQSLSLDTDIDIANIYADNGKGKTTIADAVMWVLFNKDSKGRTQFKIRTIGSDGNYIPNVENSVTLHLLVDGVEKTIKKELITKGNTYNSSDKQELSSTAKYYVDGQIYTKKDFDQFIGNIATEDTFRTVTSPTFFFSLDWKKQRSILTSLVKEPSVEDINSSHDFDIVEEALKSQHFADLEAFNKHVSYQLKEVKSQLDVIPLQIEEQKRTMPEVQDWDTLSEIVNKITSQITTMQKEVVRLQTMNASDAHTENVRQQISFQQRRIDEMRRSATTMYNQSLKEREQERSSLVDRIMQLRKDVSNLQIKIQSLNTIIERLNNSIKEQEIEQANIRTEWADKVQKKYVEPGFLTTCPTCGQELPFEKINEIRTQHLEAFNLMKAETKKTLTERANATKVKIEECIKLIEDNNKEIINTQIKLGEYKSDEKELSEMLDELNSKPLKNVDELLSINPGYTDANNRIAELEKELETPSSSVGVDNTEEITKLQININELVAEQDKRKSQLSTKDIYFNHLSRIEELQQKQISLRSQLDELQMKADQCLGYELRYGEMLEKQINSLFSIVRFSLFKHLVNGNVEPYCEPLVDGVPVSTNVNSASRMNAGLDICNTLAKHLELSAPIVIDNAEANNNIITTIGQQFRLYVSHDPNINLK